MNKTFTFYCQGVAILLLFLLHSPSLKACYADFSHTNACVGDTIWFYALDTYAAQAWDFGDNTLGTPNVVYNDTVYHIYNSTGTYYVTHFVNIGAEWAYQIEAITVGTDCLVASFNYNCSSFHNTSVGNNLSYLWDFGDPASGIANQSSDWQPYHSFSQSGTYVVSLTVSDGLNTETVNQTITYDDSNNDCSYALISYFNNPCVGDTMNFYVNYSNNITAVLWNFGDPASGINNISTDMMPQHYYSQAGIYPITLVYSTGTVTDTLFWQAYVTDCNVWAGDVNQDGEVTPSDLFPLGIYYGQTGSPRANASIAWQGQASNDWQSSFMEMYLQKMVNHKHADTNGDGIINAADAEAILVNMHQSHYQHNNLSEMQLLHPSDPTVALLPPNTVVLEGQVIDIPIVLGTATLPVNDLYGYALTIGYPREKVVSAQILFDNSFLGNASETIHLQHNDNSNGKISFAAVRTTKSNIDGYGTLATLRLQLASQIAGDLPLQLNGDAKFCSNTMPFNSWNNNQQVMFNVHLQNTTLAVHSTATEQIAPPASLLLYPNPANNQLFVQLPTNSHIQKIQISNYLGDLLFEGYPNANTTAIDLTQLPKGMYLVTVQNEQERYTQTFVKQ